MGAQQSSRRVTVNNEDDDTIGVVKISESLLHEDKEKPAKSQENFTAEDVKKLYDELVEKKRELDEQQERIDDLLQDAFQQGRNEGNRNTPSFVDENLRKTLEDKEREFDEIRKKTQFYQQEQLKKSAEAEREVLKEFDNAISEMQGKYSEKKVEPVCTSLQHHVVDCYLENKNSSLKCSQLVRDYVNCVEQSRKSMSQTQAAF
ncbi:MICOS complex subunit MIC19-like [Dendronephthya gigantea]|uniref:MICOS complex subunit MIC19-like n=1 Tax=Dendronephthya gigantea TaxID=151771 RepID=UPI00106A3B62|nr:MICOS complex subunit MIC19-like [Dendronephthya gigantea]